jgi:CHASE2 domain-containing sensor protein
MMLPYRGEKLQRRRWLVGGAAIALLGAALCALPLGDSLARLSFDLPFLFHGRVACTNVVVVLEDRASLDALGQKQFPPSRTVHAQLVDRLREEGAKTIVFDIFFRAIKPDEDLILATALKRHGNVILGSALETQSHETGGQSGVQIVQVTPPPELLQTNAAGVGLLLAGNLDAAFGVRKLLTTWHDQETIAAVAVRQFGVPPENSERWINFYSAPPSVDRVTMGEVLQLDGRKLPPDFLRGKIVFVGFDPSVTPASGERDVFATPFTRFGHDYAPGAEVLANSCANLVNGDALRRMNYFAQAALAFLFGAGAVALVLLAGRRWMLPVAAGLFVLLLLAALIAQWSFFVWWNWLVPATVQLPLAVLLGFICPRLPRVAFISYRRGGGKDFAVMLMQALRVRGCEVFLDVKDIRDGEWWPQLQAGITSAPNFILVLSPGMFDERKEDWVREEILHALAIGRKIIPIMQEGFAFPENLPAELQPLQKLQCIMHSHLHSEATIDKLEEFLRSRKRATVS